MVEATPPPKDVIARARAQVGRIEYRLGKIALDCEEGSAKALNHLLEGAIVPCFGLDCKKRLDALHESNNESCAGGEAAKSSPGEGGGGGGCASSNDSARNVSALIKAEWKKTSQLPLCEVIDLLNTCAVAYGNREKLAAALELLEAAESLYASCCPEDREENEQRSLDDLHTSTLFFFAQIHGHAQNAKMSAFYCAKTTHRQLLLSLKLRADGKGVDFESTSLDVEDWVKNVLSLTTYYGGIDETWQAEHCLLACSELLKLFLSAAEAGEGHGSLAKDSLMVGARKLVDDAAPILLRSHFKQKKKKKMLAYIISSYDRNWLLKSKERRARYTCRSSP